MESKYVVAGKKDLKRCVAGSIGPDGGPCALCFAGKYTGTSMMASVLYAHGHACSECPAGTYAGALGASACTSCPVGTFAKAGASVCFDCPTLTPESFNGDWDTLNGTNATITSGLHMRYVYV
jgi:hypothetical protein